MRLKNVVVVALFLFVVHGDLPAAFAQGMQPPPLSSFRVLPVYTTPAPLMAPFRVPVLNTGNQLIGGTQWQPRYFRAYTQGTCNQPFAIELAGALFSQTYQPQFPAPVRAALYQQERTNAALALTTSLEHSVRERLGGLNLQSSPATTAQQYLQSFCPAACPNPVNVTTEYGQYEQAGAGIQAVSGLPFVKIMTQTTRGNCQ